MYIIQEIQTENNTTALLNPITKADRNEADSAFHSILASAAISKIDVHAVVILDEHGNKIDGKFYEHISE